jgi:hypothetical protein
MAAKSSKPAVTPSPKSVATLVREAIERNGYKDVKDCARSIKVPYDLFNKVVGGHLPKDAQLVEYAKKLNIDARELILASYRQKAPDEMKKYFNSVALLDGHNATVRETMELLDAFTAEQMQEVLAVARMIRSSVRDSCRKAIALLKLYQQLEPALMEHLDSLIVLALRNDASDELKAFKEAVEAHKITRSGRRARLRV